MFIGRKEQLDALSLLWGKRTSSLVTCRGRRRIGKSTLIEEFARRTADHFINIVGLSPRKGMTDRRQRVNFCEELADQTGGSIGHARNWTAAFRMLDERIPKEGRTVVLLDEISWMGSRNPDFAGYLKTAWDKRLKKHDNLVLVLCGSVSSWIADNILDSTGFVGRDSLDIEVGELSLAESVKMLGGSDGHISSREIFDFLSVTGGVPKYLEEIHPEWSFEENVRQLCFMPRGTLFREFNETFSEVFGKKVSSRGEVLRTLAETPLSVVEIARALGRTPNGKLSRTLRDLVYAGFVSRDSGLNPMTHEPLRMERYRIRDNYTRFYLKEIEPRHQAIEKGLFKFSSVEQLTGWRGLLGLQFENMVLNHVEDLFRHFGLERSLVVSAAPFTRRAGKGVKGCQIDLLIQTERMALVVEIKHGKRIEHGVIEEVREKVANLEVAKGLSVRTALVYDGTLAPSVEADRYFDFLLPFDRLLCE
jgi:hypothetical protein